MAFALGAIASIGAKIAGTFLSAKGEKQQGEASSASIAYQAAVVRNNADLADRKAQDALARGKQAVGEVALAARQTQGQQRVALAANGVVLDQGSALDIVVDTATQAQIDARQLKVNAEREALGFTTQAQNFRTEANLLDQQGRSVDKATKRNVRNIVLTGIGSVASKWQSFSEVGIL